jgi:8-oxo-dGTP diphosphatase
MNQKKTYSYPFPRPSVTVDCVVFGYTPGAQLCVLLVRRAGSPHKGSWALPGGFVQMNEGLEEAARRELEEETGVRISGNDYLEQLYTFGAPNRDPRGRVISVAYFTLVSLDAYKAKAGSDAAEAEWVEMDRALAGPLAFDHGAILQKALTRLRAKVRYEPIGFELLPTDFTLSQLLRLYETLVGGTLDRSNFAKKVLEQDVLVEVEGKAKGPAGRPAQLYRFDRRAYEDRKRLGWDFSL